MTLYPLALKIVTQLVTHGHTAYFAGGYVRDFLMKKPSDDIDIATSATSEQILDLFPNTLLVGIQFGIVIVLMEGHPFEVATFRKDVEYLDGRKPSKIEPATPQGDAERRDFTINGMFYDPIEEKVHDFVHGKEDIARGLIRTIGNPYDRFFEDRLRMIRAVRFAARFNFKIELETEQAIMENADLLFPSVAMERINQEFSKMGASPRFDEALLMMHRFNLLQAIFPDLKGLALYEIKKRLLPLKNYPQGAFESLFLQELFPDNAFEMGRYLKMSNRELEHLNFYLQNQPFSYTCSRYESVYFYAHPDADICLKVFAARLEKTEAENFLMRHQEKKASLIWHIEHLLAKQPVIGSKDLFEMGIKAGISMGRLLKEAEKLAIENDIKDKKNLFEVLKQSPLWGLCTN